MTKHNRTTGHLPRLDDCSHFMYALSRRVLSKAGPLGCWSTGTQSGFNKVRAQEQRTRSVCHGNMLFPLLSMSLPCHRLTKKRPGSVVHVTRLMTCQKDLCHDRPYSNLLHLCGDFQVWYFPRSDVPSFVPRFLARIWYSSALHSRDHG